MWDVRVIAAAAPSTAVPAARTVLRSPFSARKCQRMDRRRRLFSPHASVWDSDTEMQREEAVSPRVPCTPVVEVAPGLWPRSAHQPLCRVPGVWSHGLRLTLTQRSPDLPDHTFVQSHGYHSTDTWGSAGLAGSADVMALTLWAVTV